MNSLSRFLSFAEFRSSIANAAFLVISGVLVALGGLIFIGILHQQSDLESRLLKSEMMGLRFAAERIVGRIEGELASQNHRNFDALRHMDWYPHDWNREEAKINGRYAALIRRDGTVVWHTNVSRQSIRVDEDWYARTVFEAGTNVTETHNTVLAVVVPAYNIRLPIMLQDQVVGSYHTGISKDWFVKRSRPERDAFRRYQQWLIGSGMALMVLGIATAGILTSWVRSLRQQMTAAAQRRVQELHRLIVVLAHEIRNPLHAVQLNVYSLQKHHQRGGQLSLAEIYALLQQSSKEVRRIEELIQQLVLFASTDAPQVELTNVCAELRAVIEFVYEDLNKKGIQLHAELPSDPHWVLIDRARFRQIILNILRNAERATHEGRMVRITLSRKSAHVVIVIGDNGPRISTDHRQRIFEPFDDDADGAGVGLALAKRFVEEANGSIGCEDNEWGGAAFRILLNAASTADKI